MLRAHRVGLRAPRLRRAELQAPPRMPTPRGEVAFRRPYLTDYDDDSVPTMPRAVDLGSSLPDRESKPIAILRFFMTACVANSIPESEKVKTPEANVDVEREWASLRVAECVDNDGVTKKGV